jgi:hypothetical protein
MDSQEQLAAGRRTIGPVNGYGVETSAYTMGADGQYYVGAYRIWAHDYPQTVVCSGYGNMLTRSADAALDVAWQAAEPELAKLKPSSELLDTDAGLIGLIYVSTAARAIDAGDLHEMLQRAQKRNNELGITGVLISRGNTFMQYLEGPTGMVEYIYQRIRKDPLHYGVVEVVRGAIGTREFAGWSMALGRPEAVAKPEDEALTTAAVMLEGTFVKATLSQFCRV